MMKITVRLKTDSEHLGLDSEKRPKTVRLRVKLCELRGLDQVTSYVYSHAFRLCKWGIQEGYSPLLYLTHLKEYKSCLYIK